MTENTAIQEPVRHNPYTHLLDEPEPSLGWHVLWTRSNFERIVYEQLLARGYTLFLPMMDQWSRTGKGRQTCRVPMFKGYLFLRHAVDKADYIDICKTKGLVGILGSRWDRLAHIPDKEIETIKLAAQSQLPTLPYPYLQEGDRVRITKGTLANAEGIFVKSDLTKGLFIISVNLLHRSIAMQVDCTHVVPV